MLRPPLNLLLVWIVVLLPYRHGHAVLGQSTRTDENGQTESSNMQITMDFPSKRATIASSPFNPGSLFAPAALNDVYPEFEGPHYIQEEVLLPIYNTCPHGVDGVFLSLPATANETMLNETVVTFALLVNDYYVAETDVSRNRPNIFMQDIIYPPLVARQFNVQLLVVGMSGTVDNDVPPSGVTPAIPRGGGGGDGGGVLTFSCAATPLAVRGGRTSAKVRLLPKQRQVVGTLDHGYVHCRQQASTQVFYLSPQDQNRDPVPPKAKLYDRCTTAAAGAGGAGGGTKRVLLPRPNEPWQKLPTQYAALVFVKHSKFGIAATSLEKLRALRQDLCGATLRFVHLQCDATPSVGGGPTADVTADFDVECF